MYRAQTIQGPLSQQALYDLAGGWSQTRANLSATLRSPFQVGGLVGRIVFQACMPLARRLTARMGGYQLQAVEQMDDSFT